LVTVMTVLVTVAKMPLNAHEHWRGTVMTVEKP
jgi:hypothetical protein